MLELDANLDPEEIWYLPNIADSLSEDDKMKIVSELVTKCKEDEDSRAEWEQQTKKVIEIASMEKKDKNTPWPGASNVKAPLTTVAVLQFASRAYPELVKQGKAVNIEVVGFDPDGRKSEKARRVGMHMNYQLLVESDEWENSLDKLLHTLPLVGMAFKKTYYDPITQKNVSELIPYNEIFIHADIKSLEEARRVTHSIKMHKNDIIERIRYGLYSEIDEKKLDYAVLGENQEKSHTIYECHCYLDLDGDGYEEPYIVVFMKDKRELLRILARYTQDDIKKTGKGEIHCIAPTQYFTDFHCIPNPDGSFYSIGLGHLLFSINDSVNSIQNQLIDSGTLANSQTGIAGRGFRIKGGELNVKMGAIKVLDTAMTGPIKDAVHMMEFKEPSNVLLQLLGVLTTNGKEVASINDAIMGNEHVQNVASSVASSQIEQGTKVFTGIQRRLFRGLKKEFEKLFRLNSIFLDPQEYYHMVGSGQVISQDDYDEKSLDIKPIADPTMASDALRMARAEALIKLAEDPILGKHINSFAVVMQYLDVLEMPNMEKLVNPPQPNAPPPLEVMKFQAEADQKGKQLQIDAHNALAKSADVVIRGHLADQTIKESESKRVLNLAQAKAALEQPKNDKYEAELKAGTEVHKGAISLQKEHLKAALTPRKNAMGGESAPAAAMKPPESVAQLVQDTLNAVPPMAAEVVPENMQQPQTPTQGGQ